MRFGLLALAFAAPAMAQHKVRSAQEVEALLGKLRPGSTITWIDGTYLDQDLNIENCEGRAGAPIVLEAESPGGVVLRGKTKIQLGASHWILRGFHFDGSAGGTAHTSFQFRSRGGRAASHSSLTDCAFTALNCRKQGRMAANKWILLFGQKNSVDHCHFAGKESPGALLTVVLRQLEAGAHAEHRIAWNYFADFAPCKGDDNECIRIGTSGYQTVSARCLVEHNYFVRCNGENEIISNKSCDNVYRHNTFRQSAGALVLRHGARARVVGNHFFGDGETRAGGIRISGSGHVISDNRLQDLHGRGWNAALSLVGGTSEAGRATKGYEAVDALVISHNTIVGCQESFSFNAKRGKRIPSGEVTGNLFAQARSKHLLATGRGGGKALSKAEDFFDKLRWRSNLVHGAEVPPSLHAVEIDPELVREGETLRIGAEQARAFGARPQSAAIVNDSEGLGPARTPAQVGVRYLPQPGPQKRSGKVTRVSPLAPSAVLDLQNWKLTLPTRQPEQKATKLRGAAREVSQRELDGFRLAPYFFVDADTRAVVFRAPCGGVTTRGSKYPRSELREMLEGGRRKASWSTSGAEVHTMRLRASVTKLPRVKDHVCIAQIHDSDDDVLMLRVEGRKVYLTRRGAKKLRLAEDYELGTPIDLEVRAGADRIRVYYNGRLVADWKPAETVGCYFKAGCYTQSNESKGDAPKDYAEVRISELEVTTSR